MRCPKCQYISFDSGERCRNCGYELSLAQQNGSVDVAIGRDEPAPGRLRDVSLSAMDTPLTLAEVPDDVDDERLGRELPGAADLPLFTERIADDQAPLVTPPAVPRAPLSVRRTTPSARRSRQDVDEPSLDLVPESAADSEADEPEPEALDQAAGLVRRGVAGLVDVAILGSIGLVVVYLTLRLCELTLDDWRLLPPVPFGAFLLLVAGGYFVLFTAASGQTIGKMLTKIRVVPAGPPRESEGVPIWPVASAQRVPFDTAVIRAVACLVSTLLAGAGFLLAVFSADRRALHDRIADTRVVSA
jgi:uncharacterized RDD family membrane protein YckC